MTVTCAWCGNTLRELCPVCSCVAAPVGARRDPRATWRTRIFTFAIRFAIHLVTPEVSGMLYACLADCRVLFFLKGCGGTSSGICSECDSTIRAGHAAAQAQPARQGVN
jgi:hypothetical protein